MCVVRKDNKLTKTHPVPNPTTNLHYQDRGIPTLIDIQMWASDSHQNKPEIRTRAQVTVSHKNMNYLNTRVLPVLWFVEWFVKFAHICLFMFKQCRRGKSQRHTLTNHHYLNSAALTTQSSFSLPSVLESTPTILATPKKLWELPLKKTYHLLFPMRKRRRGKTCELSTVHKNLWGFLQRGSHPIQVPR